MLFFKQVLDKRGLLLSPMQMATHGGDHLGSVSWSALAQGVGLDVLVEQFIGVKLWAVAGQDDQAQSFRVSSHKALGKTGAMHRMAVHNQIQSARGLFEQPLDELYKALGLEFSLKHHKGQCAAIGNRR